MRQKLNQRIAGQRRDERYEQFINSASEPFPLNHLKQLRTRDNLSLQDLSEKCGLSKQTLIRAEQGLFDEVPEKLMRYWLDQGENELVLMDGYLDFQLTVRGRIKRIFGDGINEALPVNQHPLVTLTNDYWIAGGPMNIMECAKLLCVSQPLLNHWIKNPKQKVVPQPLLTALFQNGYAKFELSVLITNYSRYRSWVNEH